MKKVLLIGVCIASFNPLTSLAGFNDLIKDVFPSGTMSNTTSAAVVKEQSAGHYMVGSLVIRTPATPPLQLIRAQAPSISLNAGLCSTNMEAFGGAISLITGKELMNHLKTLPASAATYAAMMAIKTICPQCEDLMEYLDAKADWLNKFSADTCGITESYLDGIFPTDNAKSQALRKANLVDEGAKPDMGLLQSKSSKDNGDPTEGKAELESQLGENYNLVWKALNEKTNSTESNELKQLLMTISGTIIGTKGSDRNPRVKHLKSLVNKELIKDFMGSSNIGSTKMRIYKCDEMTKCLRPVANEQDFKDELLFQKIQTIVTSITSKIYDDVGPFTDEENMLIALSSEQLILKIEMDLATFSGKRGATSAGALSRVAIVVSNQIEYIESLSYEVVTSYLQSLLVEVQEAVGELSHAQLADSGKLEAFELETREIMRSLSEARIEARGRYDMMLKTKQRLRLDIKHFENSFEEFIKN